MANVKVLTPEGRFRWCALFTPKMNYNGDGMEKSITLLIPKKSSLAGIEMAWTKAAKEEFANKIPGSLRRVTGGQKPILKDGDEYYATREEDKKEMYEQYRGCWILNATADENAPLRILGPDGADVMDPADIYDGAYGQVVIGLSTYTAKARPGFPGGAMCSVSLFGVKKTRDGEVLETTSGQRQLTDEDLAELFGTTTTTDTDDL